MLVAALGALSSIHYLAATTSDPYSSNSCPKVNLRLRTNIQESDYSLSFDMKCPLPFMACTSVLNAGTNNPSTAGKSFLRWFSMYE